MPRFYFDTREGATFTPDNEGVEFPSLDDAERAAAVAAARRIPSGSLITIERGGHLFLGHEAQVRAAINSFVADLTAAA